jgi:hypothetical protein
VGPTTQSLATVIRYTKLLQICAWSLSLLACGELVKKKKSRTRKANGGHAGTGVHAFFSCSRSQNYGGFNPAGPLRRFRFSFCPQGRRRRQVPREARWLWLAVAVAWRATSRPVLFCSVLSSGLLLVLGSGHQAASDWPQAVRVQLHCRRRCCK